MTTDEKLAARRARDRAAQAKWRAEHPERARANKQRHAATEKAKETARRWRKANPDRVNAHGQRYRDSLTKEQKSVRQARAVAWIAERPEKEAEYQARYRAKNLLARPARMRKRKYGLSVEEQDSLLASQGGCCAICRTEISNAYGGGAHLDHDHATGEARGFLCRNCNSMLGMAKDSPSRLRAGAAYLEARQPKLRLVK